MGDDVVKRLSTLEASVCDMKVQIGGIAAIVPHLATKDDLSQQEVQISGIVATLPHLATKDDVSTLRSEMKEDMSRLGRDISSLETKIIKWVVATGISCAGLASAISHFVN